MTMQSTLKELAAMATKQKATPAESTTDKRLRFVGFQIEGYVSASSERLYINQEIISELDTAKENAVDEGDDIIYAVIRVSTRFPGWKDTK